MYRGHEELENLVWDKNDEDVEKSQNKLRLEATCRRMKYLAHRKLGKPASIVAPLLFGGFNLLYPMQVQDQDEDVMIRVPYPNLVIFSDEKTMYEAATAAFLAAKTDLRIPRQYLYGVDQEIGPYTIMERVVLSSSVSKMLTRPNEDAQALHVLDSDAPKPLLTNIWTQVAASLLQISTLSFPKIGSLTARPNGATEVTGRPLAHNMNDMIRLANIPSAVLPAARQTFETADEWYTALADMHIAQLVFQHNDLVVSEDDCRNKYVARQIFRRLVKTGRLSSFGFREDNWSAQALEGTSK
ncbi:hypothetical protein CC79DRAFT_1209703 [Sarocladium strictum]